MKNTIIDHWKKALIPSLTVPRCHGATAPVCKELWLHDCLDQAPGFASKLQGNFAVHLSPPVKLMDS